MNPVAAFIAFALLIAVPPRQCCAAFEAPDDEPARLALGSSGPAWPVDGPIGADQPAVFGSAPSGGLLFSTLRWEAAPELGKDAVTASIPLHLMAITGRLSRLSLAGYSETRLSFGLVRPAAGAGWGWGAGFGRESWRVAGIGRDGWFFCGTFGYAPRPGFRAALRIVQRVGPAAASSQGSVEVGATTDPLPGWRVGGGYETARTGGFGRFKLGIECRPCRLVALRTGFIPSDDTFSAGIGFTRGIFGIDIARRTHPRLGWVQALAFRVGGKSGGPS